MDSKTSPTVTDSSATGEYGSTEFINKGGPREAHVPTPMRTSEQGTPDQWRIEWYTPRVADLADQVSTGECLGSRQFWAGVLSDGFGDMGKNPIVLPFLLRVAQSDTTLQRLIMYGIDGVFQFLCFLWQNEEKQCWELGVAAHVESMVDAEIYHKSHT